MEENKLEQCLKVLDDRWEDVDTYIDGIPDSEISSAFSFLVRDGVDELVGDVSRLKDELFLYEQSYTKDKVDELEKKIEKLEKTIRILEEEADESEDEMDGLKTKVEELEYDLLNSNQEETLDWEMVMNTFWELRDRMNPFEFEKLIKDKYGNK